MTVAALLDILKITKQSLSRVLKDLIGKGYVFQKAGDEDRRQRLLHLTPKGEALRRQLMQPQAARIRRALAEVHPSAAAHYRDVLTLLIDPANRGAVAAWLRETAR
jgi:DNA-binding MarR family transcriptional regulator